MGKWCEMATVDVKYDTTPHDGTPGPPWDDFEERILGVAAGRTDDRGWSLADCANQIDEGGAGGPPMPGGAAGNRAQTSRRKRLKELYAHATSQTEHAHRLSSAEASDSPSAPRGAGVGARQLTPHEQISSPRGTGGSPEQRGPPSSYTAQRRTGRFADTVLWRRRRAKLS